MAANGNSYENRVLEKDMGGRALPDNALVSTLERSTVPIATIEVRRSYTQAQEIRIIDAVHAALVEGLKIPDRTITVRFIAHEPHRFTAGARWDERFMLITIDLFSGRSIEAKGRLYAAMVRNLAEFDIPGDHVKVLLREAPRENWGIGGVPASAISLEYEIEV